MKDREIYVSDGSYSLCRLTEKEKNEYMDLLKEVNTIPGFYDNPSNCDIMWQIAIGSSNWEFSIFDEVGNYCGNIMLKYPDSEYPEIGIDLAGRFRNQGIGPRVIKMLARKAYEHREVEYYIIRVSSKNLHSKHVIEKLGAVRDYSDDLFFERVMTGFLKVMGEEAYQKAREEAEKILNRDDEEIYQYRYLPEVFLD